MEPNLLQFDEDFKKAWNNSEYEMDFNLVIVFVIKWKVGCG